MADPYIANVVLLCGFEGADGSTAFVDESASFKALTAVGNAQVDTALFKFGTSAALFDGTGDAITAADSADWDLSDANSDQFTVETWVRFNSLTGDQTLVSQWVASNLAWHVRKLTTTNQIQFGWSTTLADSFTVVTSGVTLSTATWYHIAVDKDSSGKIRVYVDGVMKGSSTPANSAIANSTAVLTIGAESSGSTRPLNGWLDELRITKGVARYASDSGYTVPTAAFDRPVYTTEARVTQVSLEQWFAANPDAQVTQVALEMWASVATSTATGRAKVWSGSAWALKPVKVWSGSAWVEKPLKVWNGSAWV